jgi:hypothetical protein
MSLMRIDLHLILLQEFWSLVGLPAELLETRGQSSLYALTSQDWLVGWLVGWLVALHMVTHATLCDVNASPN